MSSRDPAKIAEARDAQPNMAAARVEDVFPNPLRDGGSLLEWLALCQPGAVVATRVGDGHFKEGEAFVKVQRDDGDGVWRPVWTTDDQCDMASLEFLETLRDEVGELVGPDRIDDAIILLRRIDAGGYPSVGGQPRMQLSLSEGESWSSAPLSRQARAALPRRFFEPRFSH